MSGHSKWHKIQHKKGAADKARSNLFTKLCKAVTVAAQEGGGDPDMNFALRLAVQKAKSGNVPKDNIDRAIKRGTGELKGDAPLEGIIYEGFGPGGVAVLVDALTDNKNRSAAEIKHAFTKHGGSLGGPGSVQWQFVRKGVVRVQGNDWQVSDEQQLALMDAGMDELVRSENGVELQCPMEQFQKMLEVVQSFDVEPDDSGLEWVAKETVTLDESGGEKIEQLYEALDELDDVREVYTNAV